MSVRHAVRRLLWKFGYDLSAFIPETHALARRRQILQYYAIDTVLDVGANVGQFASQLRSDLGYAGRILSFEPLGAAFQALQAAARGDPQWQVFHYALGERDELREINVAGNSESSSFLDMLPAHLESAPHSRYTGRESIQLRSLDGLFSELCADAKNVYLKIDTQGFEQSVLKGAAASLARIDTVQMEMSLVPLYRGEWLFLEACAWMQGQGYALIAFENGFSDPKSGRLLQLDGIFRRSA
jgi:FkbM family methyltransferase